MRIKETKTAVTVVWSRQKEEGLTWGDVKEYCRKELEKIDTSKEASDIKAIITTIKVLNDRVNAFNRKRAKYERMCMLIRDNELTKKVGGDDQ